MEALLCEETQSKRVVLVALSEVFGNSWRWQLEAPRRSFSDWETMSLAAGMFVYLLKAYNVYRVLLCSLPCKRLKSLKSSYFSVEVLGIPEGPNLLEPPWHPCRLSFD